MKTFLRTLTFALPALALLAPAPNAQQQLFSLDGNSRGGEFGATVAMIGDVDGDGVPDLVVGIPLDDTVGPSAGRIRVFSGQTGALLYSVNGTHAGDEFGYAIVGIPDSNGDGAPEILVGAPYADPAGSASGVARLLSGATGSTLLTLNGANAGDRFGFSVGYGGSTGIPPFATHRLLIGAPYKGNSIFTGLGSASLYTASGSLIYEYVGFKPDAHLGWSVAGAFDANGDGTPDVLLGCPDFSFNATGDGRAFVMSGASPIGYLYQITGSTTASAHFGRSVAVLADTNNDGVPDFVVGAPDDQSGKGTATVYSGATGTALFAKTGVSAGDHFGACVASAGDTNGDGRGDVLVGAPDGNLGTGTASLFSGTGTSVMFTFIGATVGAHLGTGVAGGLDITGDGRPDVILGSPDAAAIATQQGNVRVFNGASHFQLFTIDGPTYGDQLGTSICGIGDVNGDGFGDFLVGAPEDDHSYLILSVTVTDVDAGSVRCVSGKDGSTLWTIFGSGTGDELGFSLVNLGDVNGDGKADFAVGAPQRRTLAAQPGYVRICSGANGATLTTLTGVAGTDAEFGAALATMPDVTGDGLRELLVGIPGYSSALGRAERWNSGTWALGVTWAGSDAGERFGSSLCAIADINNDGKPDVLIGAPSNPTNGSSAGRVYGRSGASSATLFTIYGAAAGDQFGTSVAPVALDNQTAFAVGAPGVDGNSLTDTGMVRIYLASNQTTLSTIYGSTGLSYFGASIANLGDYFGCGFDGLAVGATESSVLFGGQGRVAVLSGSDGSQQYAFDGTGIGDQFGRAVAAPGDVNADGTVDLLVGAPFADPSGLSSGNAKLFSLAPNGVTSYGASTPGCAGAQVLRLSGPPKVGAAALAAAVDHAPPSTLGLLLVTDSPDFVGHDIFGLGVALYVDFFAATQVYGLDLHGTSNGHAQAMTPIPNNPLLAGTHYYFQGISAWSSCSLPPFNLSASTAAEVVIQP